MSGPIGSQFTLPGLVLLAGLASLSASSPAMAAKPAAACSADQLAQILAPATKDDPDVQLTCSPTLSQDDVITKQLRFEGAASSNISFRCNGALIDGSASGINKSKDMILIRPIGKSWTEMSQNRPENITIQDCRVNGSARVVGLGANGQGTLLKASSREPGHTQRTQAAAPSNISFIHIDFQSRGRIPLYIAPGATHVSVAQSRFGGTSASTMIYLDAETADNSVVGNEFNGGTGREYLAVDGSANNTIANNSFVAPDKGGIFIYRNCGEGGVVRQQAPHDNLIKDNSFTYRDPIDPDKPGIWVGSRTGYNFGFRTYCFEPGNLLTAALPPTDDAHKNSVTGNVFIGASLKDAIRDYGTENLIADNAARQ
jgi:hypothetical protein